MKTQYVLPMILALGTIVASTQTMATGMTYDPYEIYYSKYYGIGTVSTAAETVEQEGTAFYDPYADYYNTYYGIDTQATAPVVSLDDGADAQTTTPTVSLDDEMADPSNYFKW